MNKSQSHDFINWNKLAHEYGVGIHGLIIAAILFRVAHIYGGIALAPAVFTGVIMYYYFKNHGIDRSTMRALADQFKY